MTNNIRFADVIAGITIEKKELKELVDRLDKITMANKMEKGPEKIKSGEVGFPLQT